MITTKTKDGVIDNVVRMLRVTNPTWTTQFPDNVSLEARVRDIVYEGVRRAKACATDTEQGLYGTGGVTVTYDPETEHTFITVTAGYHTPACEDEPEGWH